MAISRSRGIYPVGYFGPMFGESAYAKEGGEIFQYVSDGSGSNDVQGATYRAHIFENVGHNSIYFDKAGYVDIILIAGGGAGGSSHSGRNDADRSFANGGGGAGGIVEYYGYLVNAGHHSIYVGKGGTGNSGNGLYAMGEYSTFDSLKAFGGGRGGSFANSGAAGASAGGGSRHENYGTSGGGNGISNQGFDGGDSLSGYIGGGGGGAAGAGVGGNTTNSRPDGGPGKLLSFYSNTGQYYGGGGAGGLYSGSVGYPQGGLGGGANADIGQVNGRSASYYGGGGSGSSGRYRSSSSYRTGGNGYQGLVMVRYRIY